MGKNEKSIKGYYYHLNKCSSSYDGIPATTDEVKELFQNLQKATIEERSISINGSIRKILFPTDKIHSFSIPKIEGYISGVFTNYRDISVPLVSSENGEEVSFREIDINSNEKLTEISYFLISEKTGSFLLINNRYAVSDSIFASYLNSFYFNKNLYIDCKKEKTNMLNFSAIIIEDSLKRLEKMNLFTKITVSISVPNKTEKISAEDAITEIPYLNQENFTGSEFSTYKVELSAGRSNKVSNKVWISNLIKKVMKTSAKNKINCCRVIGSINDMYSEVDFINEKNLFLTKLILDEGSTKPTTSQYFEQMKEDFDKKDKEFSIF